MNKVNILITGLIRDTVRFECAVNEIIKLKNEGLVDRVVWSTWESEIKENKDSVDLLILLGADIVSLKEPKIKMTGHIIHQMKTFHFGLSLFKDTDYVLKIRADLSNFSMIRMEKLFKKYFAYNSLLENDWPQIFSKKIMVEGGFLYLPFYQNDITFLGQVSDLRKLTNMDLRYEMCFQNLAPEQWFFFKPFENMKIFSDYFRIAQGLKIPETMNGCEFFASCFSHNFFRKTLEVYFHILAQYFLLSGDESDEVIELNELDLFNPRYLDSLGFKIHPGQKIPVVRHLDWKYVSKTKSSEVFPINSYQDLINYQSSADYQIDFEDFIDFLKPSIVSVLKKCKDGFWYLPGDGKFNMQVLTHSDNETLLNNEINRLRREIGESKQNNVDLETKVTNLQNKIANFREK
ncbi:hypothetical protein [Marinomonas shanghaiensis]|uniref:hypothetical protein n=1 Tax=Marinomonas shanghaiensis TaxID=2202418 RepID=UPI003A95B272